MADTVTVVPQDGTNICIITISLDVTNEKAAAIITKAASTLAAAKLQYGQALIPRLYTIIESLRASLVNNDAMVDAAAAAFKAAQDAQALAIKAIRPTLPDPTK